MANGKQNPKQNRQQQRTQPQRPAPKPEPAQTQASAEPEEILVKDESGNFKIIKRGEIHDLAAKTSREVIDKIQEEIMEALKKKATVQAQSSSGEVKQKAAADLDVFNPEEEAKEVEKDAVRPAPPALAAVPSQSAPAKPVQERDWSAMADEVINKTGLGLKDPILLGRLKNIVITQLRGVRKPLDTRLILIRPTQLGGLGFDGTRADKVMEALGTRTETISKEEKKEKVVSEQASAEFSRIKSTFSEPESRPAPVQSKPIPPPPPMPGQEPQQMPQARPAPMRQDLGAPKIQEGQPVGEKMPMPSTTQPMAQPQPPTQPQMPAQPSAPKEFEIPVKDYTPKLSAVARQADTNKITDIKAPYQLVGPIQELKYPLIDFRRLADSPSRAVAKIGEKIKNLEAESFSKKVEGIKAWQSSEVFQTYLWMGLEALRQKVSLDDIIKGRQSNGQPVLAKDEFIAVNELNQKLQF